MSKNDNDDARAPRVLCCDGGGRRDRTDDLLLAKQALSQLSYAPFWEIVSIEITFRRRLLPAVQDGPAEQLGGPGRI
jgi:hypothetical protein